MPKPSATVVITTRNRRDSLATAITSALNQTVAAEILVVDDGSTDGTPALIQERFPQIRFIRHEDPCGYIVRRNQGAASASASIVFSIDDDAAFISPYTIEQTLAEFDHPQIGAVAIPYINDNCKDIINQRSPNGKCHITNAFVGTAYAIRRNLFLKLGGYRTILFHQGEERDYCLRMMAAGYVTRLGAADPIYHYISPIRDKKRMAVFGSRNNLLFAWHNVPWPYLPLHASATIVRGLLWGCRYRCFLHCVKGLASGISTSWLDRRTRHPVSARIYRLTRRLIGSGSLPLDIVLPEIPDPSSE